MKKLFGIALLLILIPLQSHAGEKPFAEKSVVLQISDADPKKQTLVLNVANNLIKHYGPDKVEIEIVAFGPGLKVLFANNPNTDRISGLATNGVRFAACQNTIKAMTKKMGKAPVLHKDSTPVVAGVVQIMDLTSEGYTLIRP